MFQNIARDFNQEEQNEWKDERKEQRKQIINKLFTKKQIILYIVAFLLSMVSLGTNGEIAPLGIALLIAILSNGMPVGIVSLVVIIGSCISTGIQGALTTMGILFFVLASVLIKAPKYTEARNEKRKLGLRLFISCIAVQAFSFLFGEIYVYDILVAIVYSISAFIFYKIFVNSISVVTEIGENRAYSVEEVMGASLLTALAITAIGDVTIFGFGIKNILCILIVMIMGWKNGILVGATSGITIGTVLGVLGTGEPIMIASYALSGMIAGILSKFGKIGVILGFFIGNVVLTYVANGNTHTIISVQEILIASLGLLAVPNSIKIHIQDMQPNVKLLPQTVGGNLESNKDTIFKLNSMSETISEIAKTYQEAAATIVDEKELKKQEQENRQVFEQELQNHLDGMEENLLFDIMQEENIIEDIFAFLLENERIAKQDLLQILAEHNQYIIGIENHAIEEAVEDDIMKMVRAINESYRISKVNFIWKKRMDESKKVVSSQLEVVSQAIENLADEIQQNQKEKNQEYELYKKEIQKLFEQKEIPIEEIAIEKQKTGRMQVKLFTKTCEDVDNACIDIKKVGKILSKILQEEMVLQKQECGIRTNQKQCVFTFLSQDKQTLQIGIAKATKTDSTISGDTNTQVKLDDGKYLIALSDGMGSGEEARKTSKMAISILEKLLSSGFDKDTSLKLINSAIQSIFSNGNTEMYATLDIEILDLYAKKLEFMKNGACPTFIKHNKDVQILKSISLPTGILENIDLVVYDRALEDEDIIVICSDGVLESSEEYTNKELWLKFLLEDMETQDVQKIADLILQEAIDNHYGVKKDDMTVIVAKVKNRI